MDIAYTSKKCRHSYGSGKFHLFLFLLNKKFLNTVQEEERNVLLLVVHIMLVKVIFFLHICNEKDDLFIDKALQKQLDFQLLTQGNANNSENDDYEMIE